jgi:hypothetical protein
MFLAYKSYPAESGTGASFRLMKLQALKSGASLNQALKGGACKEADRPKNGLDSAKICLGNSL